MNELISSVPMYGWIIFVLLMFCIIRLEWINHKSSENFKQANENFKEIVTFILAVEKAVNDGDNNGK